MPRITVPAETNFRDLRRRFGMKRADRRAHMYVIGKTGTGKSTLIASLARPDALNGEGFALLDPYGDLGEHTYMSMEVVARGGDRDISHDCETDCRQH